MGRRRNIKVRKHKRELASGTINVRQHTRSIEAIEQRNIAKQSDIQRRREERERIADLTRDVIYPVREDIGIVPAALPQPTDITISEEFDIGGEGLGQTEGGVLTEVYFDKDLKPTLFPTKTEMAERLEDRVSPRVLKKYLILTQNRPMTDEFGKPRFDDDGKPLFEDTQLVLPPLPVPGQLDKDEIFEIESRGKFGGFQRDEKGNPIFKRVMGGDLDKIQTAIMDDLDKLDPKSKEYQEKMDMLHAIRQKRQWVIFDRNGLPILADNVTVYAIKGVDSEVGDLLAKELNIYTVGDYMRWRRALADKKYVDESGVISDLIPLLDEYNLESTRSRIKTLREAKEDLGKFGGIDYSRAVDIEINTMIDPEDPKDLNWIHRMETSIMKHKMLKKQAEDEIIHQQNQRPSRSGIGGRPRGINTKDFEDQKIDYMRIISKKRKRSKKTTFEERKLNEIEHELKIRKGKKRINKIADTRKITKVDTFGRFLLASGYIKIPSTASSKEIASIYKRKRKAADLELTKTGIMSVGNLTYYPKSSRGKAKTFYPDELWSDITVIDVPLEKSQQNWTRAHLAEIQKEDPNSKINKNLMQLEFRGRRRIPSVKAKKAKPTAILPTRKDILRDGKSYFKKKDLVAVYSAMETDGDTYIGASMTGSNKSYFIRGQLQDKGVIQTIGKEGDWEFKDIRSDKEIFKGSQMIFDNKEAFIGIEPVLSHYSETVTKDEVRKELMRKIK